ncbi:NUDIX domain-containing protein [Nguyenibacter sp. L1]|uniref:NUDIX hydrolase n=1 Tax=Nguyenibacter sp. L1 TaxID=3049350 RepID=UPI002B476E49|nr:NUDIX domain-containing protein [Nguyenibacter sp. L1]WRH86403.1 NUDIX domain-containing protein [Nguyenibacter sp. L1]
MNSARTSPHDMIEKCAAIILKNRKLLVVRKRGTMIFISPGGKIEPGETQLDCLRREIAEELCTEITEATSFGLFERSSALEDLTIRVHVWTTKTAQDCAPGGEIEEIRWITGAEHLPLGSVFAECVLPELVRQGLVDA